MPNWNDPASIKKWLDQQPKTVRTERRRPTEDREERARAEPTRRLPHWDRPSQQVKREEPRPESTYKAPPVEHSDAYYEAWQKPGEHRKLDPAYSPSTTYQAPTAWGHPGQVDPERTPYTNYQALPNFVTHPPRNDIAPEHFPLDPSWRKTDNLWYRIRDLDITQPPLAPSQDQFPTTQYFDQSLQMQVPGGMANIPGFGQLPLSPQYVPPVTPDYGYYGPQSHYSPQYSPQNIQVTYTGLGRR